jgi:hypothetical protein
MNTEIEQLAKALIAASRKGFLKKKPMFELYEPTSLSDLNCLALQLGIGLPSDLCWWLNALGYGDINEELSFRRDWFAIIETGQLKGGVRFAQDILGNFYAFNSSGAVYYLSRSEPVFAALSVNFLGFISDLVSRDFKVVDWVNGLETQRYEW